MSRITTVAFDGDDTLWHNESLFSMTQERFRALLADHVAPEELDERLLATERENVAVYGFGVKGFTLSMIETAIEVTNGKVDADTIYRILSFAKDQLAHPVELLPGVTDALDALRDRYRLLLITKGDLFDQESKIARSGLAERFDGIEVVADKLPDVYLRVLRRYGVAPSELLMVGNSVKSDVLPVLEIGGRAAYVPYHLTWALEQAEPPHEHDGYWQLEHIAQVPALVERLQEGG
ncbi:MAG: haloacid dehalogenase [Acidimicrobiia bacterium]|nr:MAG: haloacid dehalogenase [Acidimicrobiia bacterium]